MEETNSFGKTQEFGNLNSHNIEVISKRIICAKPVVDPTPDIIEKTHRRIIEICEMQDWDKVVLIVDLTDAKRPNPAVRKKISSNIFDLRKRAIKMIFICNNILLKVALSFIMYPHRGYSNVVSSKKSALNIANTTLEEHGILK